MLRRIMIALVGTAIALAAIAGIADLPVKTINGKAYHYYEIQPHETLYSLQQKLGVDRATIVRYNPSVEDGIQPHQTLYFPAEAVAPTATASETTQSSGKVTHVVKKGESVYGISRQYGISVDKLVAMNPQLIDGARAGQTIIISNGGTPAAQPVAQPEPVAAPVVQADGSTLYTIGDGESLYAIARAHGVTTDEILDANPNLSPTFYRKGQTIVIPVPDVQVPLVEEVAEIVTPVEEPQVEEPSVEEPVVEEPVAVVEEIIEPDDNTISIAAILPFMLSDKSVSKPAQRYTEFFKGLVLAVDTLRREDSPVLLYAYDTAGSIDSLRHILRTAPELADVDVIITPPDEAQLALIRPFAAENDILLFNPFLVKDNTWQTDPLMMQLSTPSPTLLDKAVKEIARLNAGRTPVILRRSGGPQEHADFVDAIKEVFLDDDATPVIITYTDELTAANLERLKRVEGPLLFIPYEGKQSEAAKFLPALADYRESVDDPSRVRLAGYPEWITFRGDARSQLEKTNTTIYSRFYTGDFNVKATKADEQFTRWYGSAPDSGFPTQGYFGLDLGMFIINLLRDTPGELPASLHSREGIQNTFSLTRPSDDAGYVNELIYLINYRPSGIVSATAVY